ncbi:TIGR04552 family protein [Sulfidibacter corallicola]|uniref:TIGR04552 family protein n=1 Tax=Sulfidibacter corallicola TaxID=2818388 RepID=A0A8A4TVS3_SULCO|nr:TIGR04552 family protein [Sulfidibacter corallicola]QTD53082.1 TIGR04552 family protein [Sulfidibacter corallicola]
MIKERIKDKNNKISINWSQLNAIVTGVSAIDMGSLAIRTRAEAEQFAREYGFNTRDPAAVQEIARAHREAIEFIDKYFLEEDERELFPIEVREPESFLDLLVFSSNYLNKSNARQQWSCAVLKVMHGIFHIDHDFKLKYFDTIRGQIFDAWDRLIEHDGTKHFLTDGRMSLPLHDFQRKRNKGRTSILLKLLQKPSYVASDIYDHLGMRLVFNTKTEALFALKLLYKSHQISVTNVKPFRSKNNLLDLSHAKRVFNRFRPLLERSGDYPLEVFRKMDEEMELLFETGPHKDNPHSSIHYQSIQVTVRKMVRVPNPLYQQMEALKRVAGEMIDGSRGLGDIGYIEKELAFYFDYEIQLMDRHSYEASISGPASHDAYKRRQIQTARRRVLGPRLMRYLQERRELMPETATR